MTFDLFKSKLGAKMRKLMTLVALLALMAGAAIDSAAARPRHHHGARHHHAQESWRGTQDRGLWDGWVDEVRQSRDNVRRDVARFGRGQDIGGRPSGCPPRYCGCGASLHLFGRIIPFFNLASNWLTLPRAEPAPDMAAARAGHVFVLKRHLEGKTWLVYDANTTGGRTRLHPRSIEGFTIVNPRGRA